MLDKSVSFVVFDAGSWGCRTVRIRGRQDLTTPPSPARDSARATAMVAESGLTQRSRNNSSHPCPTCLPDQSERLACPACTEQANTKRVAGTAFASRVHTSALLLSGSSSQRAALLVIDWQYDSWTSPAETMFAVAHEMDFLDGWQAEERPVSQKERKSNLSCFLKYYYVVVCSAFTVRAPALK